MQWANSYFEVLRKKVPNSYRMAKINEPHKEHRYIGIHIVFFYSSANKENRLFTRVFCPSLKILTQ